MTWPTVPLVAVCDIVSGATPQSSKSDYWDGDVAWVTPKDLSHLKRKHLDDTPRKITRAGFESCSAKMLPANSVLFSSRAPIGLVAINTVPVCTNQGFKSMVPQGDRLSPDYLYWWLRSNTAEIQSLGRGATFKEVSKSIVERISIPLPPLPEQKRIAAILDAVDALRTKRLESLEVLDKLVQAVFLYTFGDPVVNPKGWDVVALPDLAVHFTDGPFGSNLKSSHYRDSGVRVIRLQNIGVGKILDDDLAFISEGHYARHPRNHCGPGDVLIATLGDPRLRAGVLPATIDRALNKADCLLLRVDSKRALAVYVSTLLNSQPMVEAAGALVRGQTRGRISKGRLSELEVPLPPLSLQERFANAITRLEGQVALARTHLAELDTLFASLQSRAFGGEL